MLKEATDYRDKPPYTSKLPVWKSSLEIFTFNHDPEKHARLLIQMARTFLELANIEESIENRKKAGAFFARSLQRFSIFTFPFQYGANHSMIGDVYQLLGHEAEEALMVYPKKDFPTSHTSLKERLNEVTILLADHSQI